MTAALVESNDRKGDHPAKYAIRVAAKECTDLSVDAAAALYPQSTS